MTLELANELADNEAEDRADQAARAYVDPCSIPTRFSLLKTMALSPAHYEHAAQQDQDDSLATRLGAFASDRKEAFRVGNAIDVMLVSDTDEKVIIYPAKRDKRVKAWQDFQKEAEVNGVVEILSPSEMDLVKRVVSAIRARKDAMDLMFKGTIVQKRIDWQWMGKAVRSTPDARSKTHTTDLKSSVTADPQAFKRQSMRFFYHAQAELYAKAMTEAGEPHPADQYLVVVEKSRPHPVTIFRFTAEMLELGAKMNRLWMERLLQCEAAKRWPVYAPEPAIVDLDVEEGWDA